MISLVCKKNFSFLKIIKGAKKMTAIIRPASKPYFKEGLPMMVGLILKLSYKNILKYPVSHHPKVWILRNRSKLWLFNWLNWEILLLILPESGFLHPVLSKYLPCVFLLYSKIWRAFPPFLYLINHEQCSEELPAP